MGRCAGVVAIGALAMLAAGCEVLFPAGGGADAGPPTDDGAPEADGPPGGDVDGAPPDARTDGPPGDFDGDTILDGIDNCPVHYNIQQRDEDFDGAGDPCDPCPGLAVMQTDADGDKIGDGCDLFPATETVVIAKYFLEGGASPLDWTASNGDWSITSDHASQNNETFASADAMLDGLLLPVDGDLWVEIGVTPMAFDGATATGAGVWIDADAIQPPLFGHYCQLGRSADGASFEVGLVERYSSDFPLSANASLQVLEVGATVRIQALDHGDAATSGFDCYEIPQPGTAGSLSDSLGIRRLGLHTRSTAARFGYVIIYHQPVPLPL